MGDPILQLVHDHRELSGLIVAVHEALARIDRGQSKLEDELHEIGDGVEAFREALLEHFAREQEGLLPFVVSRLPAYRDRSDGLIVDHDRIAEALTKLASSLHALTGATLAAWKLELARFEELYTAHSKTENAFLDEVARALSSDEGAAEQLHRLLNA